LGELILFAVPLELAYPLKNNLKIIGKKKFVKAISDFPVNGAGF
jgi:hypothetical protein